MTDENSVLVVAAGKGARDQAITYAVYHTQNRRSFRPCRWIAFYANNSIDTLAEVDGEPEHDVIIGKRPELAALAAVMPTSNGDPMSPHSLFRLKSVSAIGPIENDLLGANGRRTAYTQRQRYTTIDRIRRARRTSEL
ncbi:MAG: hypothetical protein ACAI43_11415 [Phycisphaerae bacterium]